MKLGYLYQQRDQIPGWWSEEFSRNVYDQESYHTLLAKLGWTLYCIGMSGEYENSIEEQRKNKIEAVRSGLSTNSTREERQTVQETLKLIEKVSPQLFSSHVPNPSFVPSY